MKVTASSERMNAHRGLVVCVVEFDDIAGLHGVTLTGPITEAAFLAAAKTRHAELKQDEADLAAARVALAGIFGKAVDPDTKEVIDGR